MKLVYFTLNSKFDIKHKEFLSIYSDDWLNFFNKKYPCLGLPAQDFALFNKIDTKNIKCIILTGGNDAIKRNKYNFSYKRNNFEYKLITFAIKNKIPLIGVCRGMHIINLYFGGKVLINLKTNEKKKHLKKRHTVILFNRFKKILNLNKIIVNSYHTQGFYEKNLGKGLKIGGVSNDNLVEALYHKNHNIYGLQWHPERNEKINLIDKKLINKIIKK